MLRTITAALVLALVLPATAPAASTCTVSPDPVTLGVDQTYTVTATGAIPGVLYEVIVQQVGHHKPDESGTVGRYFADEAGNLAAVVVFLDGRTVGEGASNTLWPGEAKVKIQRYRAGGGSHSAGSGSILLATCSFGVV